MKMSTRMSISSPGARRRRDIVVKCEPSKDGSHQRLSTLVVKASSVYGSTDKRPLVMGGTAVERSMLSMGSIAIYNVKPVVAKATTDRKSYTVYAVHVQNAITGRSWVVHRRYSEFLLVRQMVLEHFEHFQAVFPKLQEMVAELYFPRKHKLRSNTGRVVQHRCTAFLEYLVVLHRLLISQAYLEQKHISDVGVSILRGFLGSAIVKNPVHKDVYAFPNPIPQCKLTHSDRAVLNQCGTLKTVLEDDQEYEDCLEEEEEEEEPVADSAEEEVSMVSDTDSHSTTSDFEDAFDSNRSRRAAQSQTKTGKLAFFAAREKTVATR